MTSIQKKSIENLSNPIVYINVRLLVELSTQYVEEISTLMQIKTYVYSIMLYALYPIYPAN